jgi:nitrogen regulatory protein PII-like uncharacterized protein
MKGEVRRKICSLMLVIAGGCTASVSWADISEATFTRNGSYIYASVPVSEVEVFVFKPEFKFRAIGVIEARGMAGGGNNLLDQLLSVPDQLLGGAGEKEDIELAMKALKDEAAKAGATGVVIVQSRQVRVSQDATERRIKAVAIRRIP